MIGRPLIRIDEVSSTMDVARAVVAQGASPGTAVLAGHQTAGRGRANRTWATPPWTAVLLSFVTASQRPANDLGALSLLWGWAVAETVDAFVGGEATIKWPNDVLVDDQKIAGILTTNSLGPAGQVQITGIGLNVSTAATDLPSTGTSIALLTDSAPVLDDVLETLFVHLNHALGFANDFDKNHLATLVEPRLAFQGQEVTVQDGDRMVAGTLQGLDLDGALRLSLADGSTTRVVAGDLTRGPRRPG